MTSPAVVYPAFLAAIHVFLVLPALGNSLPQGRPTANEAASPNLTDRGSTQSDLRGWSYAYALSDTAGYDFPEENEKGTMQIVKEVALWVVIAGFVAFFIVKVFLQGDTDEPEPENPPKPLPQGAAINAPPARSPL